MHHSLEETKLTFNCEQRDQKLWRKRALHKIGSVFRLLDDSLLGKRTIKYLTGTFYWVDQEHTGEQLRFFFFCFLSIKERSKEEGGDPQGRQGLVVTVAFHL